MRKLLRRLLPLSLRVRFLLATAGVVMVLSLAYGMVALVGYSVSFDKTTFRLLRGESNLFYTLSRWENNHFSIEIPENLMNQRMPANDALQLFRLNAFSAAEKEIIHAPDKSQTAVM